MSSHSAGSSPSEPTSRVFWTSDEIREIAAEAAQISLEDRSFLWAFVAKAQNVLPAHRQRDITGRAQISSEMIQAFTDARNALLEQREVPVAFHVVKEVIPPREQLLATIGTEELLLLLAQRLGPVLTGFKRLVDQGLNLTNHPTEPHSMERPLTETFHLPTPPSKKRKVLITGFSPKQSAAIEDGAKGFDLELVVREKITGTAPIADFCIVGNMLRAASRRKLKDSKLTVEVNSSAEALKALADYNSKK